MASVSKLSSYFCGILVLVTAMSLVVCEDSDADIEKECAERFEVDAEEAIAVLRSENKTISEAIMCYAKCWMEKHELFEEDGSINLEKGYESFKKHGEKKSVENDDKEKFQAALKTCNEKHNKENCELAGHTLRCVKAEMKAA